MIETKMNKLLICLGLLLALTSPASAALYALIDTTGAVSEMRDFATAPPNLARKGIEWRPVVITDPAFDPVTQIRTGPVDTIFPTQVTRVWTVRSKTAQELDDDKTAQVDAMGEIPFKSALDTHNSWRVSVGLATVTEAQYKATLKTFIGAAPPAPDTTKVAMLKGTGAPAAIQIFTATISPTSVAGAAFTDQSFTVTGLLTTDHILAVRFTAGLLPITISYMPMRVSAANTLVLRFAKIATGAVVPAASQAITVLVAR